MHAVFKDQKTDVDLNHMGKISKDEQKPMHKYLFCKNNTFNIEKSESEKKITAFVNHAYIVLSSPFIPTLLL